MIIRKAESQSKKGFNMIKEIIVVEGKDDISAVKKAVDAEVIATSGYHISKDTLKRIELAEKRRGIIIFTDPDHAGEQIRKRLSKIFKNAKHAFLPQDQAIKKDDIGIENAKPEDIVSALENARVERISSEKRFDRMDLINFGLEGKDSSGIKRQKLGKILGIGYCNSKQFLRRLNNYGITREEFLKGMERLENE